MLFSCCLTLLGCTTAPPPLDDTARTSPFTHGSVGDLTPRYFRCIAGTALPFSAAPVSARDTASVSAGACKHLLAEIVQAIRTENAGRAFAEDYARRYGEALASRMISDVERMLEQTKDSAIKPDTFKTAPAPTKHYCTRANPVLGLSKHQWLDKSTVSITT